MPQGAFSLVAPIVNDWQGRSLQAFLDCGVGFGVYGAVIRQWVDGGYWPGKRAYICGIEGFAEYRNPAWELYDYMHAGMTIQEWLAAGFSDRYDVILLLDVLEHFEKDEGADVLTGLKRHLNPGGVLYVGTPQIHIEQGAAYGNKLEIHRSLWTHKELEAIGFTTIQSGTKADKWGHRMILCRFEAAR